jgi:hypothetical protein
MSQSQTIEYNLAINADMSYSDLRKLETSLVRCLNLAQRLTGDENVKNGIQYIQKAIMTLRTLQMAYHAVQIARMSAGDPIAWLSAGTMVASAGLTIYDTITGA